MSTTSPGARFKQALSDEKPLQIIGTINANHALLAKRAGYRAIYLSGGGVAAGSMGIPDLGITTLEDVLTDVRRITNVCDTPLLVDADTGFGASAFNIARTVKDLIKAGAAAMHIEDQVGAKRCGHRPNKEVVSTNEMVDRIKAAVDARTNDNFSIMARIDALRERIICVEDAAFTADYHDPSKRSIANALTIEFMDGSLLGEEVVEYPIGHARRREAGIPLLIEKYKTNLARIFDAPTQAKIIALSLDYETLVATPVNEFMDLLAL